MRIWTSMQKPVLTPTTSPSEEVCAEVMGPKQKEQLRRMIGFRFKRHESLACRKNICRPLRSIWREPGA